MASDPDMVFNQLYIKALHKAVREDFISLDVTGFAFWEWIEQRIRIYRVAFSRAWINSILCYFWL